MKKRTLLIGFVIMIGIGGLYLAIGPEFLPWMRDEPILRWSPRVVDYEVEIVHTLDSTYAIMVRASAFSKLKVTRAGDSSTVIKYDDGFFMVKSEDVFGYDSSIVRIARNKVKPLQTGTCQLLVRLPTRIDTSEVTVKSEEWGLAVYLDH